MVPFGYPGAGNGPMPITIKAVTDLDLLPNLKCITGLEHKVNTPKPTKLLNVLVDRFSIKFTRNWHFGARLYFEAVLP